MDNFFEFEKEFIFTDLYPIKTDKSKKKPWPGPGGDISLYAVPPFPPVDK